MVNQRRMDLMVMEDFELSRLEERFRVCLRIARETGADQEEIMRWQTYIEEIGAERAFRLVDDADAAPPWVAA